MKKITLIFASVVVFAFVGAHTASAQAVEEGSIIIDPYYGAPNFGKILTDLVDDNIDGVETTGIGPLGLRAEYMLSDRIGVGVDFIYNSVGLSYQDSFPVFNSDNNTLETEVYDYDWKMERIRIQGRFSYHFATTDVLDPYFGAGAGTNFRSWTFESTQPGYENDSDTGTLLPFSLRFFVGMRYYFTENIGLNAEIGLIDPLLSGGISVKF